MNRLYRCELKSHGCIITFPIAEQLRSHGLYSLSLVKEIWSTWKNWGVIFSFPFFLTSLPLSFLTQDTLKKDNNYFNFSTTVSYVYNGVRLEACIKDFFPTQTKFQTED